MVTNDDGIWSPGLKALAEVGLQLGDVIIAAPAEQQTSMSRAKPRPPTGVLIDDVDIALDGGIAFSASSAFGLTKASLSSYAICASPALCVIHAVLELAPRKPSLCLSGINYGENIGYSLTASGTIGAALEAQAFGIPGLAVSLETPIHLNYSRDYPPLDWRATQFFAHLFAKRMLTTGLPDGVGLLNLNVPMGATEQTPVRWTQQSRQNYYTWSASAAGRIVAQPMVLSSDKVWDMDTLEADSDIRALAVDRVVSVTPVVRNVTASANMVAWSA